MKIIIVANNIIGDKDGIGKHARMEAVEMAKRDGVDVTLISGTTTDYSVFQRAISLEMHKAFSKTIKAVKNKEADVAIVEYPFNEFNPIVVLDYKGLKRACEKANAKLVLSMHEYDRVKPLRKRVIESFIRQSDVVLVSEPHYIDALKELNKNVYLRTIPNHLIASKDISNKDTRKFAYFGMVNKAKAFDELIEAWKQFNKTGDYTLDVITVSEIEIKDSKEYRINLYIGESDEKVAELLSEATFAVLPIKPCISYNNSSMISCAQCGCIIIGKASKIVDKEGFVIETGDYSLTSIERALNLATHLDDASIDTMRGNAIAFGSSFTIESTVSQILERLR